MTTRANNSEFLVGSLSDADFFNKSPVKEIRHAMGAVKGVLTSLKVNEALVRHCTSDILETLLVPAFSVISSAPQYIEEQSPVKKEAFLSLHLCMAIHSWLQSKTTDGETLSKLAFAEKRILARH